MATESVLKAFLFTDIVGATALKRRVGDIDGADAISRHDVVFRECLGRFNGEEHDNPGDGFFASFALPSDALRCGLAFQQGLAGLETSEPVRVRVGVHMGESVRVGVGEQGSHGPKLLGLAVDTAARVMALAQPSQTLLTRHAFDSVRQQLKVAPDGAPIQWLAHGLYVFKGVDDPIEVFEAGLSGLSPLAPPPTTGSARRVLAPGEEETLGWRPAIGQGIPGREAWEVVRKVGEGGFGEVWLAQHTETRYLRTFKFCFHSKKLHSLQRELKLFRLIKEVLGDRPDIARLYEVRLSETPYFLEMEYTAGGNLSDWAETCGGVTRVPLETRLQLVAQVGDALAAAHSIGVIHKDVKPGNILIHEERDGSLQARLTDFGIGELLRKERLADAGMTMSAFEDAGAIASAGSVSQTGTQLYMAPELLAGRPSSIQTDVYALGVLLFQVVAGDLHRPIAHGWERDVDDELLREDIAACVAGDPSARLSTADELSRRLRSLEQRRQEKAGERRRVVAEARRRGMLRVLSAAAALLLAIAAVSAVGLWRTELARRGEHQARQRAERAEHLASREVERAVAEAAKAQRVLDFLLDMFASVDPAQAQGREVTVRDVLEIASPTLDDELAGEPEIAAAVHGTIGRTYLALGYYEASERHLQSSLELYRETLGEEHPETLQAASFVGELYYMTGRFGEAEALLRATLATQERVLGDEHRNTIGTMELLAETLAPLNRPDDLEKLYRRVLEARQRLLGEDDPMTYQALNNLAGLLRRQNRPDDAEEIFREVLARQMEQLGPDHPHTLMTTNNLAGALRAQGRPEEAESLYREVLAVFKRVEGPNHPITLGTLNNLARTLADMGRYEEAESHYREALDSFREVVGDEHPTALIITHNLARTVQAQGRYEDALELFAPLIEKTVRVLSPEHVYVSLFRGSYGECLTELGQYEEAERQLLAALEDASAHYDKAAPQIRKIMLRLVALYEAWDKPDQADVFQTRLGASTQPAATEDENAPND